MRHSHASDVRVEIAQANSYLQNAMAAPVEGDEVDVEENHGGLPEDMDVEPGDVQGEISAEERDR
eukprot:1252654-Alexandrium_andersonii.AAC.1